MHNPTTTSFLPTLLACVPDLQTALARVHAYHVCCERRDWTGADVSEQQRRAYHTIVARVAAAYNRLDLGPSDREKLVTALQRARDENAALRDVIAQLRTHNERLTAANVAALEERRKVV